MILEIHHQGQLLKEIELPELNIRDINFSYRFGSAMNVESDVEVIAEPSSKRGAAFYSGAERRKTMRLTENRKFKSVVY